MSTFTRNSQYGSAKATTRGPGDVEVDLVIAPGVLPDGVGGGIVNPDASTHSLMYRDQPCGGAHTDDVAASALVQGF